MKLGYAVTFHHSEHIRPNGKKVLNDNLSSFYESCKYDFDCVPSPNTSNIFPLLDNLFLKSHKIP